MAVNRNREAWKTYGNVFDEHTIQNLRKLSTQGHFIELTQSIAMGKEANVFAGEQEDGSLVAVKIYRLENCNFNKMFEYISQDPRYMHLKGQKRKIIFAWTQREYRNLMKAREVIRVPTALAFKDNLIVMEFVEEHGSAAPQLKNLILDKAQDVFDEIISMVKKLWKVGLVHGDLSEFNILMQYGDPVFIDFSQSTATNSLNAKELLRRDLEVLCKFFRKQDVESDVDEIFESVVNQPEE